MASLRSELILNPNDSMERFRVVRCLRIAVTALSLTACVLLIALWVRSRNKLEWYGELFDSSYIVFMACHGRFTIYVGEAAPYYSPPRDAAHRERRRKAFKWTWETAVQKHRASGTCPNWKTNNVGFNWSNPFVEQFVAPFWFPIVLAASVGTSAWLPWCRRFSLRTLLIVTTLVAAAMGTIIYLAR
jgi:hypothetical protein